MRNLIKEYIESGKTFEDLKTEFGISANEFGELICLNYSQVDSPKTESIVRQCRGIIIDKNTYEIVHYPFFRFFNFDEVLTEHEKFNWNNVVATTKIDGSLFGVFYHNNTWHITTRSQIGGNNMLTMGMLTFGDLFNKAIHPYTRDSFFNMLNKDIDYTFELTSPYNQIVTPYTDTNIWLIGAREKNTFNELNLKDFYHSLSDELKHIIKVPEFIPLVNPLTGEFRGFDEMKKLANNCPNPTDEGFVVVDYSTYNSEFGYFPRMKVKNSSYVALHHLRGTIENGVMNYGEILNIIWKNEQAEVLTNLPQYKQFFDEVEEKFKKFLNDFSNALNDCSHFFLIPLEKRADKEIKKQFALTIDKRFSPFLFGMFNKGLTFKEFIETEAAKKTNNGFFKTFWENVISKY